MLPFALRPLKCWFHPRRLGLAIAGLLLTVGPVAAQALPPGPPSVATPIAPRRSNATTRLDTAQIRRLLDRMIQVTDAKDIEGLVALYSPDTQVEVVINLNDGRRETIQLTGRQQIRTLLDFSYPYIERMKSRYSELQVRVIEGGKKAIATYVFEQEAVASGQTITTTVDSTTTFAIVGSEVLITEDRSVERPRTRERENTREENTRENTPE